LGFHLASETTSERAFAYFLAGYQAHQAHYGFAGEKDPALDFFRVHALAEPQHRARGRELIEIYLSHDSSILPEVQRGAKAFMDGFAEMFGALRRGIFGA
jgi:hypothetical protein